jgi:hypothetical protein
MIEVLKRGGRLVILDSVREDQVLIEFPLAEHWQAKTGCQRFVRLRETIDGAGYALIKK